MIRVNPLLNRVLIIVSFAVLAYGAIVGYFVVNESGYLYFPSRVLRNPPPESGVVPLRVELKTDDGLRIVAWEISVQDTGGLWLLYFHGNGGNIATPGSVTRYAAFQRMGLNVLAADYRGYGDSEGEPSEDGLYLDARAAYRYLREDKRISPDRIVVYGFSLGAAVAIDLLTDAEAGGLIVEGAFTSVAERGQELYPFVPVQLVARSRYASIEKIERITVPKLFIHATHDEIIPIHHGRSLFEKAGEPKTFIEVAGGHNNAAYADPVTFYGEIGAFVKDLNRK